MNVRHLVRGGAVPAFRPHIAIVDPSDALRRGLAYLVSIEFGLAVASASGLENLPARNYQIIVFGDCLPAWDGPDTLAKMLRARFPNAFLVFLAEASVPDVAAPHAVDAVLTRQPLNVAEFISTLRAVGRASGVEQRRVQG